MARDQNFKCELEDFERQLLELRIDREKLAPVVSHSHSQTNVSSSARSPRKGGGGGLGGAGTACETGVGSRLRSETTTGNSAVSGRGSGPSGQDLIHSLIRRPPRSRSASRSASLRRSVTLEEVPDRCPARFYSSQNAAQNAAQSASQNTNYGGGRGGRGDRGEGVEGDRIRAPSSSMASSNSSALDLGPAHRESEFVALRIRAETQKLEAGFQVTLDKLRRELDDLRLKRASDKETFRQLRERLERDCRDLRLENAALNESVRAKANDLQVAAVKTDQLEAELNNYRVDNGRLESRCSVVNESYEKLLTEIKSERLQFEKTLAEKEAALAQRDREQAKWMRGREEHEIELMALREQLGSLRRELGERERAVEDLKRQQQQLVNESAEKLNDLLDDLKSSRLCLDDERRRAKAFEEKASKLYMQNRAMKDQIGGLGTRLESMESEARILRRHSESLQRMRVELSNAMRRKALAEEELEKLRDKLVDLQRELNRAKGREIEQTKEIAALQGALNVQSNRSVLFADGSGEGAKRSSHATINRLTDVEGQPIFRLAHRRSNSQRADRPLWWNAVGEEDTATGRGESIAAELDHMAMAVDRTERSKDLTSGLSRERDREVVSISEIPDATSTFEIHNHPPPRGTISATEGLLQAEQRELQLSLKEITKGKASKSYFRSFTA